MNRLIKRLAVKKKRLIIPLVLYFLGAIYLIFPVPVIPDLPESPRSQEPGDTYQIPGVWAYYTHLPRQEAVDFFRQGFSRSSFLRIPLITYVLNHPPEYCKEAIQETRHFDFCEEVIHPLRDSLLVAGWTPSRDVEYQKGLKEPLMEFQADGKTFPTKVTLKIFPSPIWGRILIWTGIVIFSVVLWRTLVSILRSPWFKKR